LRGLRDDPCRENIAMSNRTAKLSLVEPHAGPLRAGDHYPRALVMWSVLAFSLSSWAVIVLAVANFV
jgi:hypothetical protein